MTTTRFHATLQTILRIDAATCVLMGLLLCVASKTVAGLTAIPGAVLLVAGLLCLAAAGGIALIASCRTIPARAARAVVAGNALWVLASVLLPLSGTIAPNLLGWAFLLAQAGVVAALTILEYRAYRPDEGCGLTRADQTP